MGAHLDRARWPLGGGGAVIARDPLVIRAIRSLDLLRPVAGATDAEVGWALAVAWREALSFESTYVKGAWKALALALNEGSESKAFDAALWLAEPGAAMDAARARLDAERSTRAQGVEVAA